jgi:predicted PurR-regulated permease PerM
MQPSAPSPARLQRQAIARIVLAVALTLLGLYILEGFLRALVWAVILVIATWPLYRRAKARLPNDRHNIVLPGLFTLGTTLVVVVPLVLLGLQIAHEARGVTAWIIETRNHGMPQPEVLRHLPVAQAQVDAWWQRNLADPEGARALLGRVDREDLMNMGRSFGSQLLHRGVLFVFTLATLFFLYRDGRLLAAQMLVAANRLFGAQGEQMARQIVASIHGTVDGLVLVSLGIGIVLGIGYAVIGVPHPALLGAATVIGAMVPLGATVVLALACLIGLAVGVAVLPVAILAGLGVVVIFAADHFIRPGLIGSATRLPFLWVLLGILGGVESFGILGLFLGPAVMAALILLWREWTRDATTAPAPRDSAPNLPV